MTVLQRSLLVASASAVLSLVAPAASQAGAVIFNNLDPTQATVALGVNDQGHLNFFDPIFQPFNVSSTGLSYRFSDGFWRDATAPGCLCEGWGLAATDVNIGRVAGWASIANGGIFGLTGGSFGSTNTTASSTVSLAGSPVKIQHFYGISLAPHIFQGNVVITNEGSSPVQDIVYRRVMDWDVPLTEFYEFVTHSGVQSNLEAAGGNVRFASDNGFASANPEVSAGQILDTTNIDFVKSGPEDHGSVFDFAFGNLAPGESRTFNIFYGAAGNLSDALDAIAKIDPDVYSLGQSTLNGTGGVGETVIKGGGGGEYGGGDGEISAEATDIPVGDSANDAAPTFLFAFKGIDGSETGMMQDDPVLPFVPAPGQFEFPAPTPRRWFDPPFVTKFDYSLDGGEFLSFILPSGFTGLDLMVGSTTYSDLISDGATEYSFLDDFGLTGVTAFSIADIKPLVGVDAADPTAFPVFLDFTPGAESLTMMADMSTEVTGSAQVPGPLSILGCGAAFSFSRRLRTRIKLSKLTVS